MAPWRSSMRKTMVLWSREPEARSKGAPDAGRQGPKLRAKTSAECLVGKGSSGTRLGSATSRSSPLRWPQAASQGEQARQLGSPPRSSASSRKPSGVAVQSWRPLLAPVTSCGRQQPGTACASRRPTNGASRARSGSPPRRRQRASERSARSTQSASPPTEWLKPTAAAPWEQVSRASGCSSASKTSTVPCSSAQQSSPPSGRSPQSRSAQERAKARRPKSRARSVPLAAQRQPCPVTR
mmetsp:Transcript_33359/g.95551  ORF Transcript_33359/g.95551 Transcript_33359/m.95551 type:complete len:239 (-) Transcript_33359:949-1665(-)